MGLPFVKNHHSTGVAEPPSCSIIVQSDSTEDGEWEEFTPKEMLETLYRSVKSRAENLGTAEVKHGAQPTPYLSRSSLPFSRPFSPSPFRLPPQLSPYRPSTTEDISATKHEDKIPPRLKDIIQLLSKIRGSSSLFSTRLILISDSGGQPNYLDVFPLFVRNKCLALFTLKLNERLDNIPKLSYCIRGIDMTDMAKLQCSHEQLLESLVKSMSSFHPSLVQSSDCRRNACFAVIGTFADKIDECKSESLEEKNSKLAQNLKAYEDLQIREDIVPINAITSDDKQRKEYRQELRSLIRKSPPLKFDIKVIWFGFYLCLSIQSKAEQRAILSLQECLDIGSSLNMNEQETRDAIDFFHNLNLLLHYPTDTLDNFVIIDLKPIFELVSKLISLSFLNEKDLREHFKLQLTVADRRKLKEYGSFSQQTLEENFTFPEPLNAKAFIDLLGEVKAVAIVKHSKQPPTLFMPCLLNYATKVEEDEKSTKAPYPLILRLYSTTHGYVPLPPGFSPTLIVLLLSSRSFGIDHDDQQYRNIFVLRRSGNKGNVTIFERRLQLEIYYSFNIISEYSLIRSDVHKAILETEKRLNFDTESITIEDSFPCSCSPPIPDSRHIPCKPALDRHEADFDRSGRRTYNKAECVQIKEARPLKKKEFRWLSSGMQ